MNCDYAPYKYATEAGINLYLGLYQLCQQEDFPLIEETSPEDLKHYNIYFICQRNRTSLNTNFIKVNPDYIELRIWVHKKDEKVEVPVCITNKSKVKSPTIKSKYPYSIFELFDENGDRFFLGKTSYVLDSQKGGIFPRPTFLDLEVLYVGQTTRSTEKPTIERLINHQTLQSIYSKTISNSPDKEIYLVLCAFIQKSTIEVSGTMQTQPEYEQEDLQRFKNYIGNKLELTYEQRTTLTEASLIKYFQPIYNKEYKGTFPTSKHSKYNECYKLDLNAVSIEINTELFYYSATVNRNNSHYKMFPLINDAERRILFDYSVGFDNNIVDESI